MQSDWRSTQGWDFIDCLWLLAGPRGPARKSEAKAFVTLFGSTDFALFPSSWKALRDKSLCLGHCWYGVLDVSFLFATSLFLNFWFLPFRLAVNTDHLSLVFLFYSTSLNSFPSPYPPLAHSLLSLLPLSSFSIRLADILTLEVSSLAI